MNAECLVIWTIYDRPKYYSDHYVARKWLVTGNSIEPTDVIFADVNLESLRKCLPDGLCCVPRMPDDDPAIIEAWL